jgi:hypothetical protein
MTEIFKKREDVLKEAEINKAFQFLQPDGSSHSRTFDEWYDAVDEIRLHDNVPEKIRRFFDGAKNVLLYSWFSYEMAPVADLYSCTLVEKALRIKYKCEGKYSPPFADLLKKAIKDKLLNDSGFHIPSDSVIRNFKFENEELMFEEYIRTKEELETCQNYIKPICNSLPKARNCMAHGNGGIYPGMRLTLKVNSEIINMLFKD